MNLLRASLYEHIAASRWRLIDQGFADVANASDDVRRVSVQGSSQFPSIFSFLPGQSMMRNGSWVQWSQIIEGRATTFALRFASLSDTDAFLDLLPHSSVISQAAWDTSKSSTVLKFGESTQKDETLSAKFRGQGQQRLADSKGADVCSPTQSEDIHVPTFIQHICALSHDLQHIRSDCVAMSRFQNDTLVATISVIRAMSDYVNRAPESDGSRADDHASHAHRPTPASGNDATRQLCIHNSTTSSSPRRCSDRWTQCDAACVIAPHDLHRLCSLTSQLLSEAAHNSASVCTMRLPSD